MDLPNLKDLKAILKLCRSQGVNKITLAEMIIEFGEMPRSDGETAEELISKATPTDEELAYWSSQPDPLLTREEASQ